MGSVQRVLTWASRGLIWMGVGVVVAGGAQVETQDVASLRLWWRRVCVG